MMQPSLLYSCGDYMVGSSDYTTKGCDYVVPSCDYMVTPGNYEVAGGECISRAESIIPYNMGYEQYPFSISQAKPYIVQT